MYFIFVWGMMSMDPAPNRRTDITTNAAGRRRMDRMDVRGRRVQQEAEAERVRQEAAEAERLTQMAAREEELRRRRADPDFIAQQDIAFEETEGEFPGLLDVQIQEREDDEGVSFTRRERGIVSDVANSDFIFNRSGEHAERSLMDVMVFPGMEEPEDPAIFKPRK